MQEKNNLLGFGCQITSMGLFLIMHAFVKVFVAEYPLTEVMFFRAVSGIPFLLIYLYATSNLRALKIHRPIMHLLRAIMGASSMFLVYSAYKHLTFAEAAAIIYIAPIFITIMSVLFLSEQIYIHRTIALILGFIGVLVIVKPSMDFNWYYLFPLGAAFVTAVITLVAHQLTKTDHPISIAISFNIIVSILIGSIVLYNGFSHMDTVTTLLAILMGTIGSIGQIFNTYAIKHCNPSFYAVTRYSGLFGSAVVGLIVFKEPLTLHLIIGIAIIVISGVYIAWREHVKNKKDRLLAPLKE